MNRRARMLAAAVALAVAGGLTATAAPVQAATSPVPVGFTCTENLIGGMLPIPLGTIDLPVDLSVLDNLTVPVGSTIAPLTGTLGLAPVLAALGQTLSDAVGVTSSLVAQVGTNQVPLVLDTLDGAVQVPSLPVPALPGILPVSLAPGSSLTVGLKGALGSLLGTVSCVLHGAGAQLANILVRTPAQISTGTTVGAGPVSYDGGSGGALFGQGAGGLVVNPCTLPVARAARSPRLSARAARGSAPSRVAQRIVVHTIRTARGTVVACYGATPIARSSLLLGHAVLRLPRFYPGRYRITVRYLGAGRFRGATLRVRMSVTR